MAGVAEFPTAPIHPKGHTIITPEPEFHKFSDEPWVMDKSVFHLYSQRALTTARNQMPDAKVIITLRDPIELMLSMHQEHSKRLIDYNVSQSEMLAAAAAGDYQANPQDSQTWSFLAFPRLKHPTLQWIEAMGGTKSNRIRIIPISSIRNDSLATLNSILEWLDEPPFSMDKKLPHHNEGGAMNSAGWPRVLRQPPTFIVKLAKILLPSHSLRKAIFDPLRRPGFKVKKTQRPELSVEQRADLEEAFAEEIEFLADLESHIDPNLIISH